MRAIQTHLLSPETLPASATERNHIYNGLDCCVTMEVFEEIAPQLDNLTSSVYAFERELQAPILEMSMRGVLVDQHERQRAIALYESQIGAVQSNLQRILIDGLGFRPGFNWRSPDQVKELFYGVLQLPEIKKDGRPTTERDALEKLGNNYFLAEPLVNHILFLRDIAKKVSTLKTEIDPDGRMRTTYNIGGTNTGRLSSSFSVFDTGGNLQNWEEQLRRIFISDPGMKFAYIDLEQAESRAVGAIIWNLFHDGRYLDACESGDLHTTVCRLTNPALPWTGDLAKDKEIAETPFYRQHSYRHMNKVLGHGTNYLGTPFTMEKHTKIAKRAISEFQGKYFTAFPGIPMWHQWVRDQLRINGFLISLMNRRRWFFGRRTEDETIRAAVAYDPQGSVGDILNTGMLHVWRANVCQLLLQIHDAILIQYPDELEDEVVPAVRELIRVSVELKHGRTLTIPTDAKVGWNWAPYNAKTNPDGLKKYKPHDERRRSAEVAILDRRF